MTDDFDMRWMGATIRKETWHLHRRLLDHYGIVLQPGQFSEILREIRSSQARTILWNSSTKRVVCVTLKPQFERIFVLVEKHYLVTILPPSKKLKRLRRELD